jgi:hypothetical protein
MSMNKYFFSPLIKIYKRKNATMLYKALKGPKYTKEKME